MPIFLVLRNFTSAQHGVSVKFIRWGMRKKVVHRIAFRCQNGSSAQQSHALSSSSSLCWMKRFFRECFCLLLSFMGVVVAINQTHVHSHSLTYSLLPLYPSKTNTHTHTHTYTHTHAHSYTHALTHVYTHFIVKDGSGVDIILFEVFPLKPSTANAQTNSVSCMHEYVEVMQQKKTREIQVAKLFFSLYKSLFKLGN